MSQSLDLDYCLDAAREAARIGAAILEEWRPRFQVREKARADLVTEADFASQKAIREYLLGRFPEHHFLGEEELPDGSPPPDVHAEDTPPLWIVDPLDGTANYVHDCPMYCVSIGLRHAGQLHVGVIYDPRLDELFAAATGKGADCNGMPIQVSAITTIREAMLATGFPAELDRQARNLDQWRRYSYVAQGLRRTGSTALNLAYVACGRFDGYWAFDNKAWDVAGGVVLVREAGGTVTSITGHEHNPFEADILASNGHLHPSMLAELNDTEAAS